MDGGRSALVGAFATFVVFAWRDHDEYEIPAEEVARIDRANRDARGAALVDRRGERRDAPAMSPALGHRDPHRLHGRDGRARSGPAPKRIVVGYGFWIFLLSDIVMFSCFFAAYAVLLGADRGRAERRASCSTCSNVALETACLLLSSFTCGMASIAADERNQHLVPGRDGGDLPARARVPRLELREFADLVARGAGPTRSAFLSAFFTLVGCHGLHVSAGMLWLLHDDGAGLRQGLPRRHPAPLPVLRLFWHALDIIWVAIFTVVYLLGARHERRRHDASITADLAPGRRGRDGSVGARVLGYLDRPWRSRSLLTATSFFVAGTDLIWQPCDSRRARRARDRADGRAPGVLPAHHHRRPTTPTTCWRSPSAC